MRISLACLSLGAAIIWGGSTNRTCAETPATETSAAPESATVGQLWFDHFAVQLEIDDCLAGLVEKFEGGKRKPAPGTTVSFYQNGKFIKYVRTDETGTFQAKIPVGIYSVVAGDLGDLKGFTSTSVNVVPYVAPPVSPRYRGKKPAVSNVQTTADGKRLPPRQLKLALIPAGDVAFLRAQIASHIQPMRSAARPGIAPLGSPSPVKSARAQLDFSVLLGATPEGRELFAPVAKNRVLAAGISSRLNEVPFDGPFHFNHQMFIKSDNTVHGRLSTLDRQGVAKPVPGADVFLVQSGAARAAGTAGIEGTYVLRGVAPGVYSVIIVTRRSFGAFGIEYLPIEYLLDPKVKVPNAVDKRADLIDSSNPFRLAAAQVEDENGSEQQKKDEQEEEEEDAGDLSTNSTIMSPEDAAAFLDNTGANGLESLTPTDLAGPQSGGGAVGGSDAGAAIGAAVLGSLLGYGLYEALKSHNN